MVSNRINIVKGIPSSIFRFKHRQLNTICNKQLPKIRIVKAKPDIALNLI